MAIKVLKMGLVVSLLLVLVGGAAYILTRPTAARADLSERGGHDNQSTGGGRGGGSAAEAGTEQGSGGGGQSATAGGRGLGAGNASGNEDCGPGSERLGQGAASGRLGEGRGRGGEAAPVEAVAWEVIAGSVVESGSELLVDTEAGDVLVGLGPEFYREEQGFEVQVGDEVEIRGYAEDGEFKAGTVSNLTTGEEIVLRDDTGRPMWSGRGNNQNRL